jgi:hypothetical protein
MKLDNESGRFGYLNPVWFGFYGLVAGLPAGRPVLG